MPISSEGNAADGPPRTSSRKPGRSLAQRLLLIAIISIAGLFMISFSGQRPENIGATNGRLAEIPDSPNCVATQTVHNQKRLPPIRFQESADAATERLKAVIERKFPRAKLVCESDNYLHFEFTSLIFRFVDDVEFLVNDELKQIDFRSASRVGHSDLGANRKRMLTISSEMQP